MALQPADMEPVPVYARVEEVDVAEGLVRLDCTSANSRALQELLAESHRQLRRRWRRSFGLIDDPTVPSMDLLSNVPAAIVTVRVTDPERWQETMDAATWIQLQVPALTSASEDPPTVSAADFEAVPPKEANKISAILDMVNWPRVPAPQLSAVLDSIPAVEGVVVHDVGQGSANALFDSTGQAVVYFDTGRGGKMMSAPTGLQLCACSTPLVVLSHWDRDHWAAAEDGKQGLLKSHWVVPSQKIAGTHAVFAALILQSGGSIFVVKRSSKPKNVTAIGQHMYITYGKGMDRNNSGLVLTVRVRASIDRHTLFFPGDARYHMCEDPPHRVDLLVASHHGADPLGTVNLPKPNRDLTSRLVYSFGPANGHKHPFKAALTAHETQGWNHTGWNHSGWNQSPTAGNVRATYAGSDKKRQSIVFPASAIPLAQHFSMTHGETLSS